jgi:hypothetical protein
VASRRRATAAAETATQEGRASTAPAGSPAVRQVAGGGERPAAPSSGEGLCLGRSDASAPLVEDWVSEDSEVEVAATGGEGGGRV